MILYIFPKAFFFFYNCCLLNYLKKLGHKGVRFLRSLYLGCLVAWLLGCLVGCLVTWLLGCWLLGCWVDGCYVVGLIFFEINFCLLLSSCWILLLKKICAAMGLKLLELLKLLLLLLLLVLCIVQVKVNHTEALKMIHIYASPPLETPTPSPSQNHSLISFNTTFLLLPLSPTSTKITLSNQFPLLLSPPPH